MAWPFLGIHVQGRRLGLSLCPQSAVRIYAAHAQGDLSKLRNYELSKKQPGCQRELT